MKVELKKIKEENDILSEWKAELYIDGKFEATIMRFINEHHFNKSFYRIDVSFKDSILGNGAQKFFQYINERHGPIDGIFMMEKAIERELDLLVAEKKERFVVLKHLRFKYPDVAFKMRWKKDSYCLIWEDGPSTKEVMKEADKGLFCNGFSKSSEYDEKYPGGQFYTQEWNFKFARKEQS